MSIPRRTALALGALALPALGMVIKGSPAVAVGCTVVGTPGDDVLTGTARADVMCGLGGNDVLRGLGGNDVLRGLGGNDVLRGGDGNDTIFPGRGRNEVHGNAGIDILSYDDLSSGTVLVDIPNGTVTRAVTDTITTVENVVGTAGNDRIIGDELPNRLFGRDGNDVILGGLGDDQISGAAGNDTFYPGPGSNVVHGHAGTDTVRYDDLAAGTVKVDIPNRTVTRAVNDMLTTTENVFGTARNDYIIGSDRPDRLVGQGGNDVIFGGPGDDSILGAAGDDRIHPGAGDDVANGQEGTDQLNYGDLDCVCFIKVDLAQESAVEQYNGSVEVTDTVVGFEDLIGSDSWDILKGTDGTNYINGAQGRDVIYPRLGADTIDGGGWYVDPYDSPVGGDSLNYSDRVSTGVTVDLVQGTGPDGTTITMIANVIGTNQDDTLVGAPDYAGHLYGLGGDDSIRAWKPCGSLWGGDGDDTLRPDLTSASCIMWDDHGSFSWYTPQEVLGGAGQDRVDLGHATSGVELAPPDEPYGDFDDWSWMLRTYEQTVITAEIISATPWADVLQGGADETQVTFHGKGGVDAMDTTDGFGGDAMIQDGPGAGTTCVGDPADTADC